MQGMNGRNPVGSVNALLNSREERPPNKRDWYRCLWLYRDLNPSAMPELEHLLQESQERRIDEYKQKATDAATPAVKLRRVPGREAVTFTESSCPAICSTTGVSQDRRRARTGA